MRIVVVGEGKVGQLIVERLTLENHDVTVIDKSAEVLSESEEFLDILTVGGNAASIETLKAANVDSSDLLIATTDADETNLLCCLSAKKLGCKATIARVRNPMYVKQAVFLKEELGLSLAINPELAAAQEIFRMIQFPSFLKRESFEKGRVELVEIAVSEKGLLNGKKISEALGVLGERALICAVERGDKVSIPNGSFVLHSGDKITLTAARTDLAALIKRFGLQQHRIKKVLIVGASVIAGYLVEDLLKLGVKVKVIDNNRKICDEFAYRYPDALVICGDASKKKFLESDGLSGVDAVITLTGIDEENLIISMYCDKIGVQKTVTKIDRNEYYKLFSDKEMGSIVCPKELTANEIVSFVRAMSNSEGVDSVKALHRIVDDKAEALEFVIKNDTDFTGIPLSKLNIKQNILIAGITRNGEVIIPKGEDVILKGDTVVVVTLAEDTICDITDIFKKDVVK